MENNLRKQLGVDKQNNTPLYLALVQGDGPPVWFGWQLAAVSEIKDVRLKHHQTKQEMVPFSHNPDFLQRLSAGRQGGGCERKSPIKLTQTSRGARSGEAPREIDRGENEMGKQQKSKSDEETRGGGKTETRGHSDKNCTRSDQQEEQFDTQLFNFVSYNCVLFMV